MSERREPIRITAFHGLSSRRSEIELPIGASPALSNIEFFRDGWGTRKGYTKVNASGISAEPINGLYDGFNDILLAEGTNIRRWNSGGGTWDTMSGSTSQTNNAITVFKDLNGLDIMVNGAGNEIKSWDGTTFQTLAGSPPTGNTLETWYKRLFIGGLGTNSENEIQYCNLESPTVWPGNFIRVGKRQRGYNVIALKVVPIPNIESDEGAMGIFCDDAIFHFRGFTRTNFIAKPINPNVGCVSNRGVQTAEGITYWVDENGCYASHDGGKTVNLISWAIQPDFDDLTAANLNEAIVQNVRYKRQMWFTFPGDDITFVYSYGLSTPMVPAVHPDSRHVWSKYEGITINAMAEVLAGNAYSVYGGDNSGGGFVWTLDNGTSDDGTAISWNLETGRILLQGSWSYNAILRELQIIHDPISPATVTVDMFPDLATTREDSQSLNGAGEASVFGTGIFGVATWGGQGLVENSAGYNNAIKAVKFKISGSDLDKLIRVYEMVMDVIPSRKRQVA